VLQELEDSLQLPKYIPSPVPSIIIKSIQLIPLLNFRNNGVVNPTPNPQPGRTRVSLFVWVVTLDLSGMGGPTGSTRYRQHSCQDHVTTQAPPLRQSRDTFRGTIVSVMEVKLLTFSSPAPCPACT